MIASPRRISPSSPVSESRCPWYGRNAFGTSLILKGICGWIECSQY